MSANANGNGGVEAPVRNRFFYGKLMDVRHFEMEQRYFNEKRWLLNRLGLGAGVLAGLEVVATEDGRVVVRPGVAIDGRGREIVVDRAVCVERPLRPTDECGRPAGADAEGPVTLAVCLHECDEEPVAVRAPDCGMPEECRAGAVRERFRLVVTPGRAPAPVGIGAEACAAIFPAPPPDGFDRRRAACETLPPPRWDGARCVPLATVSPSAEGARLVVESCPRTEVYSNATLLELILCLAERVDRCCAGGGRPVTTAPVVRAIWPPNAARLTAAGGPGAPAAWFADLLSRPRIELTFDRRIAPANLADPLPWLRAWALLRTDDGARVQPLGLRLLGPVDPSTIGVPGETVAFAIDAAGGGGRALRQAVAVRPPIGAGGGGAAGGRVADLAVLVQIRSADQGGPVRAADPPTDLLDAEFAGTGLGAAVLDTIWDVVGPAGAALTAADLAGLGSSGATLPSGDGTPGGRLDAFFALGREVPPAAEPPRVRAVWPPSGARLARGGSDTAPAEWFRSFALRPRLEITFDRAIDPAHLDDPDRWLRCWALTPVPDGTRIRALRMVRDAAPERPVLGEPTATATYLLPKQEPGRPTRYLVRIASEGGAIAGAAPPDELDADFAGLDRGDPATSAWLDRIVRVAGSETVPERDPFDLLRATGAAMPSGDGAPGGVLELTFRMEEEDR